MQLIRKWKDKRRSIINYLYKFPRGLKFLYSYNPASIETDLSVIIKAGAQYEKAVKVPQGTAHFLEHMLGNPNHIHKTNQEIDAFEFGDRSRPNLLHNASTGYKAITEWGNTNYKGQTRLAKRIFDAINYPLELFKEHMDNERRVIVAETKRDRKPQRDLSHQFHKFMIDSQMPGYSRFISGELKDLKKITPRDLSKYYKATFTRDNAIIAVQSRVRPRGEFLKILKQISDKFSTNKANPPKWPIEKVKNIYKMGYFHEPDEKGAQIFLTYFAPTPKKLNYRRDILQRLQRHLLWKVGFDYMREEKGMVYAFELFNDGGTMFSHDIEGVFYTVDQKDITRSLNMTYEVLYEKAEQFLLSPHGERWFQDFLSKVIFPKTDRFNPFYAYEKAFAILHGYEIFIVEKLEKEAEKISIKDLIKFLRGGLYRTPLHIFISSAKPKKSVMKAARESNFHKRWSSRVGKKLKK